MVCGKRSQKRKCLCFYAVTYLCFSIVSIQIGAFIVLFPGKWNAIIEPNERHSNRFNKCVRDDTPKFLWLIKLAEWTKEMKMGQLRKKSKRGKPNWRKREKSNWFQWNCAIHLEIENFSRVNQNETLPPAAAAVAIAASATVAIAAFVAAFDLVHTEKLSYLP